MKILIDADGCPVVKETINIAKENKIEVMVFCDTSHIISSDYAKTVTVSKGADSVDFSLVNQVSPGDIVVTQDYGLSAMVLSKGGKPITQNGNDGIVIIKIMKFLFCCCILRRISV